MSRIALSQISDDAKLYLKPSGFIDSPQFYPDTHQKLAGGLVWFSQIELFVYDEGKALHRLQIAVQDWEDTLETAPDAHRARMENLFAGLITVHPSITVGPRTLRFDQPHVMGILNMTPDSFSDGGKYGANPEQAADAGFAMSTAGASILDIGGESTRPGAKPVWEGDEIQRVIPVIEQLAQSGGILSIDTRKAAVMEAALAAGAHMVNDVSALLYDDRAMDVVVRDGCPVILMHSPSSGDNPHKNDHYGDVVTDTFDWLEARVEACINAGVKKENIIIDIGLGFGKAMADNLALMNNITMFHALGQPMLVGASRKRMIGALSKEAPVDQRLGGSIAFAHHAVQQGAQIVRVHDVPETVQAIQIWRGMRDAALTARV